MTPNADPWRTLGLAPGATLDEIRRAYRRLAKVNHPDAAGDAALPRFLAIQSAYEQLAGPGRIRRVGARPANRPPEPGPSADAREPWRADPNRARASGRADGRRTPGARPAGAGPRTRPPTPGGKAGSESAGSAPGATGSPAGAAPGSASGPPPDADRAGRSSRRRPGNSATPGSTSYEGADLEPFEPGWSGATWYGASSGTYWTINPKEYADPRKHGPEYQARARRSREGWIVGGRTEDDAPGDAPPPRADAASDEGVDAGPPPRAESAPEAGADHGPQPGAGRGDPAGERPAGRDGPPDRDRMFPAGGPPFVARRARRPPGGGRHQPDRRPPAATAAATATPTSTAADASGASRREPVGRRGPGNPGRLGGEPGVASRLGSAPPGGPPGGLRAWIEQPADEAGFRGPLLRRPTTPTGRVAMALLGWPPLGLFAAAGIDETTGCGRFTASCPEVSSPGTWIVLAAIFLLLLALPAVAAWSAHGAIAALIVGVPSAVILSAAGGTNVRAASAAVLLAVLAVAYLAGIAYAVIVPRIRTSPA